MADKLTDLHADLFSPVVAGVLGCPRGAVPRCGHFLQIRPDRRRQPRFRPGGAVLAPCGLVSAGRLSKLVSHPQWRQVMPEIDARLREDVHQLGELLGDTIREQYGPRFLDKIELIRKGARLPAAVPRRQQLTATLDGLEEDELLPVARAFNQFLNLANIAEQYHRIRRRRPNEPEHLREPGAGRAAGASQGRRACPEQLARQLAGRRSNWC